MLVPSLVYVTVALVDFVYGQKAVTQLTDTAAAERVNRRVEMVPCGLRGHNALPFIC